MPLPLSRVLPAALVLCACAGSGATQAPAEHGFGVTVPTPIAEGKRGDEPTLPVRPKPPEPKPPPDAQPDPEPLRMREQWQYDVVYERGQLRVATVRRVDYPSPVVTARQMGRFALELWLGQELIERVRFDFPLLGAEEPSRPGSSREPSFAAAMVANRRVLVPRSPRATRARILDRATGASVELPWPPDAPLDAAADASAAAGESPK